MLGRLQPGPALLAQPFGQHSPQPGWHQSPKEWHPCPGQDVSQPCSPPALTPGCSGMAPAPWAIRMGQSIPTLTPPQPFQQEAFTAMSLAPATAEPGSCPTPPSAPWILLEAQRGSQPSTEHAGVSSEHAACTQHTQSRVGEQWAVAREGDGRCTGTKLDLGPTSWWESSRTGTLG